MDNRQWNGLKEYGMISHPDKKVRIQNQLDGITVEAQRIKEAAELCEWRGQRDHAVNILAGVLVVEGELNGI